MLSRLVVVPILASLSLTTLAAQYPQPNKRQSYTSPSTAASDRQDAVKEAFTFAWDGYYKYAFPHDELHPVANSYSDSRYPEQIPYGDPQANSLQKWVGSICG